MKRVILTIVIAFALLAGSQSVFAQTATNTFTKNGNTYVVTKTISEGKVTIETKIYDSGGNLIDTKQVVKDAKPTPVKEPVVYPTKSVTAYPTKSGSPSESKPTPLETHGSTTSASVTSTPTKTQKETINSVTYALQSDLPLSVDEETGSVVVQSESGQIELKINPEIVVEKAVSLGLVRINELRIVASGNGLKYMVEGNKQERLFLIIKINLPTTLTYTTDTGSLEKVDQTMAVRLADFLSR